MKNLKSLSKKIEELKKKAANEEKKIEESFFEDFGFENEKTKVMLVKNEFLSIEVSDYNDLTNFLNNCKPFINSHRIKHGNFEHDILNSYRVQIENNEIGNSKLKFTTYLINDFMIWLSIDFSLLPSYIIDKYTKVYSRSITDSEYHYFSGISASELRRKKLRAIEFKGHQLSWYGGSKTLLSHRNNEDFSPFLENLINELKNNPNKEQY